MTLISNTVTDPQGRPIAAAQVAIRDNTGALVDLDGGNPVITDSAGAWSAELAAGTYSLVITKGDLSTSRLQEVCGEIPVPVGFGGPSVLVDISTIIVLDQPVVIESV